MVPIVGTHSKTLGDADGLQGLVRAKQRSLATTAVRSLGLNDAGAAAARYHVGTGQLVDHLLVAHMESKPSDSGAQAFWALDRLLSMQS